MKQSIITIYSSTWIIPLLCAQHRSISDRFKRRYTGSVKLWADCAALSAKPEGPSFGFSR